MSRQLGQVGQDGLVPDKFDITPGEIHNTIALSNHVISGPALLHSSLPPILGHEFAPHGSSAAAAAAACCITAAGQQASE